MRRGERRHRQPTKQRVHLLDRVRRALVSRADLGRCSTVLDVGCGTGSLVVLAAREIRRVLRPGGELHLVDFAGAHAHGAGRHPGGRLDGNGEADVLRLLEGSGFTDVAVTETRRLLGRRLRIVFCRGAAAEHTVQGAGETGTNLRRPGTIRVTWMRPS